MTQTPTLAQFTSWARDVQPAAKAVLMARVFAQMERERVNAYILPIFQSYGFTYDLIGRGETVGRPLTTPDHLYCSTDEVQVAAYYAECDAAHRAHGFTGPTGHCPALRAEHLLMETESLLMGLAKPLFGIGRDVYGANRVTFLELLIGACFAKDAQKAVVR